MSRLVGAGTPPPADSGDLVAGTWDFYVYSYVGFSTHSTKFSECGRPSPRSVSAGCLRIVSGVVDLKKIKNKFSVQSTQFSAQSTKFSTRCLVLGTI